MFTGLLAEIRFSQRSVSSTVFAQAPTLTHCLPSEVGEPKEFERLFKRWDVEWSQQVIEGKIFDVINFCV